MGGGFGSHLQTGTFRGHGLPIHIKNTCALPLSQSPCAATVHTSPINLHNYKEIAYNLQYSSAASRAPLPRRANGHRHTQFRTFMWRRLYTTANPLLYPSYYSLVRPMANSTTHPLVRHNIEKTCTVPLGALYTSSPKLVALNFFSVLPSVP